MILAVCARITSAMASGLHPLRLTPRKRDHVASLVQLILNREHVAPTAIALAFTVIITPSLCANT